MPAQDRESRDRPWVTIFILLSLIAHLLFVLGIVLVSHFVPEPKLPKDAVELSSTSLSLEQAPPPTPPPPKQRPFADTTPDAGATHKETEIESNNDTRLRSESQEARAKDAVMPDMRSKHKHATDLRDAPNAPNKNPEAPSVASEQKTPAQKTSPAPPNAAKQIQPKAATAAKPTPEPVTQAKETNPNPAKVPTPDVAKEQFDPNGLPVLPALQAQTLAPASQQQKAEPVSSVVDTEADSHGAVGVHGDNSPEAMETELGKYKAKVYRAISSRWHPKVDAAVSLLPVGMVHIQFTIYKDGRVETKVLEGDNASLQLLLSISQSSIIDSAPFDPFTETMVRDVGDSYTDDCTFSIYGNGD